VPFAIVPVAAAPVSQGELPGTTSPAAPIVPHETEGFSPAPMPDEQVYPQSQTGHADLRVFPTFVTQPDPKPGEGYLPGSTVEDVREQDDAPAPAVDLEIPLE
jgi:hypothetical protein